MNDLETTDEIYAIEEAWKAHVETAGHPMGEAIYRAGWIAGRDWAREQVRAPERSSISILDDPSL